MSKIESFIDDIIHFLSKFVFTFFTICFLPLKFLKNLSAGLLELYIKPVFFTIIALFVFIIYYLNGASSGQDIEQEIVFLAQRMNDMPLFEKVLYTFPLALVIRSIINIVSKFFFISGVQRRLFSVYFNYLFSASLLLFISTLIVVRFLDNILINRRHFSGIKNYDFYIAALFTLYLSLSSCNAIFRVLRLDFLSVFKFCIFSFIAGLSFPLFMTLMNEEVQIMSKIYPNKRFVFHSYSYNDNKFYSPFKKIGTDSFCISINTLASNNMEKRIYLKRDGYFLFYSKVNQIQPISLVITNNKDSSLIVFAESEMKFIQFSAIVDSLTLKKMNSLNKDQFDLYIPLLFTDKTSKYISNSIVQPISFYPVGH